MSSGLQNLGGEIGLVEILAAGPLGIGKGLIGAVPAVATVSSQKNRHQPRCPQLPPLIAAAPLLSRQRTRWKWTYPSRLVGNGLIANGLYGNGGSFANGVIAGNGILANGLVAGHGIAGPSLWKRSSRSSLWSRSWKGRSCSPRGLGLGLGRLFIN
ncbi:hypothetical protein CEXT_436621 [Caerostris extrusa]|uniref:Uncharacterized protein n=1 Tax=Caerostris extrusa TaxID=172846 RepID=A0AAV4WJ79_CAEEX|nr:hypothetical protein CEXT_436621 [Caerostris extrusa]